MKLDSLRKAEGTSVLICILSISIVYVLLIGSASIAVPFLIRTSQQAYAMRFMPAWCVFIGSLLVEFGATKLRKNLERALTRKERGSFVLGLTCVLTLSPTIWAGIPSSSILPLFVWWIAFLLCKQGQMK